MSYRTQHEAQQAHAYFQERWRGAVLLRPDPSVEYQRRIRPILLRNDPDYAWLAYRRGEFDKETAQ